MDVYFLLEKKIFQFHAYSLTCNFILFGYVDNIPIIFVGLNFWFFQKNHYL